MLKIIFRDSMIYGLADAFFKLVNFCMFPIFAHLLSVEQFGTIGLTLTITGLFSVFYSGIHNTLQRYYFERGEAYVTTAFVTLLILSSVFSLAILGAFYPFKDFLEKTFMLEWNYILISILTIIPAQICTFSASVIRLNFSPWKFSLFATSLNGFTVIASLSLVAGFHLGILGFISGALIASILVAPLGLWLIRKELTWGFDTQFVKEIIAFGNPYIVVGLAFWVFSSMDRWMLGELSSLHEVGLYSVAFKISMLLMMVKSAFNRSWSPHAYNIYEKWSDYKVTYSRTLTIWTFLLTLGATCLSLFSPEFFAWTTPKEFSDAGAIVIFGAAGMVLFGITEISIIGISLKNQTKYLSKGAWYGAITNLILNYLLIPSYGGAGSALATFISYGVLTLYYLYYSQKLHPIPLEYQKLFILSVMLGASIGLSFYLLRFPLSAELFFLKCSYIGLMGVGAFAFKFFESSKFKSIVSEG